MKNEQAWAESLVHPAQLNLVGCKQSAAELLAQLGDAEAALTREQRRSLEQILDSIELPVRIAAARLAGRRDQTGESTDRMS